MPELRQVRLRPYTRGVRPSFEQTWGEKPMSIEFGSPGLGWDSYMTCGTPVLKELHAKIGAHLAKLAHEAHA